MLKIIKYLFIFLLNFILNQNLNILGSGFPKIFHSYNEYDQKYTIPNTFTINNPINVLRTHFSSDATCKTNLQNLIDQTTSTNRILLHELMNTISLSSSYSSETSCNITSSYDYTSHWTDTDTTQMIHLRKRYYQCCFKAEMMNILNDISPTQSILRGFMNEFHTRLMSISEYILYFTDAFLEYSQNDVTNIPKFIRKNIVQFSQLHDIYNYKEFFVSEVQTRVNPKTKTQDLHNLYEVYEPWIQFIHNCIKSNPIISQRTPKNLNTEEKLFISFYSLNILRFTTNTTENKEFVTKVYRWEYPYSTIEIIKKINMKSCTGTIPKIHGNNLYSKTKQLIDQSSILNDNEKNTLKNNIQSLNTILNHYNKLLANDKKKTCNWGSGKGASVESKRLIVGLRNNNGEHFCGGVLIHSLYVLTAAHCVDDLIISEISVSVDNLYSSYNPNGDNLKDVTHVTIHPDYDSLTKANDIAILTLKEPIPDQNLIATLGCLPENYENLNVLSYGWGVSSLHGQINHHLQEYSSNLITNEHCEAALHIQENENPNKLCAWGSFGSSVCYGDSGGPLYLYDTLIGVISYGIPCGIGYPDVYVNLNKSRVWIDNETNNLVSWICPIPENNEEEVVQSSNIAKELNLSNLQKDQLLNLIYKTQNVDEWSITTESFDIEFDGVDIAILQSFKNIKNNETLFEDLLKLIEIRLLAKAIDFYNIVDIDSELEKVDSADFLSIKYLCNIKIYMDSINNNDKYFNYFNSLINANIDDDYSCYNLN